MAEPAAGTMSLADRWRGLAQAPAWTSFSDRSELAAMFVRRGDTVCDLGAGAQQLKTLLPSGCRYVAVDCVAEIEGTHVANFEEPDFPLPPGSFDVVAALGLFEHIHRLDALMGRLADAWPGTLIVFSYDFWRYSDARFRFAAVRAGVPSRIPDLDAGARFFSRYVRDLSAVTIMRRRVIFTGVLGRGEPEPLRRRPATSIVIGHTSLLDFAVRKLTGRPIAPPWLV